MGRSICYPSRSYRIRKNIYGCQCGRGTPAPNFSAGPQQNLSRTTLFRIQPVFPNNAVEYFVSYYDYYHEAYIPVTGPISKRSEHQRRDRKVAFKYNLFFTFGQKGCTGGGWFPVYGIGTLWSFKKCDYSGSDQVISRTQLLHRLVFIFQNHSRV